MTLNGTLEDFSPAGILKVLATDGRTGAARFRGPVECTVYLHRGQLYFARSERTDEALATALVRPGRLTADDWGLAIEASEDRPAVGELLVRDGAIAPDLLASVVLSVIYDPLIELFRDGTGEFDFETDTVHWLGPFRAFPVDAIVGEVRKRAREVDEWSATIPSLDSWVEANRTLPGAASQVTLLREDWELVTALSAPRTIEDLGSDLGRGIYSTARVVNRLRVAGLVRVLAPTAEADVVPLHRPPSTDTEPPPDDLARDPLLDRGLPHRSVGRDQHTDPLTAHIGDAIADALAHADHEPVATGPTLTVAPDVEDRVGDEQVDGGHDDDPVEDLGGDEGGGDEDVAGDGQGDGVADDDVDHRSAAGAEPEGSVDDDSDEWADGIWTDPDVWTDTESELGAHTAEGSGSGGDVEGRAGAWDESRRVADGNALHHDGLAPTSLDEPRPKDPNAAWLADLYAQFIDDDATSGGKKRRRNEPNPVDVAFKSDEQDGAAKVSTLKRLLGALKKL